LKALLRILLFCLALAFALTQRASANLVQDAGFSSITYSGTATLTTVFGQFGTGTGSKLTVADWTTTGYNFVFAPSTADTGSRANGANAGSPNEAPGEYNGANGYGNTYMWGPANGGGANGLPATYATGAGNFIAMDGAFQTGAVSQTIGGLTVGQIYVLKFYWAGAQQESYSGTTSESLTASLGGQSYSTTPVPNASKGFTGWMQDTLEYTATNSSETLSFLAVGTPNGEPPFTLLGGINLQVIPDFSNWAVFAGFGTACVLFEGARRRRRRVAVLLAGDSG
jgi:hypothetical protein